MYYASLTDKKSEVQMSVANRPGLPETKEVSLIFSVLMSKSEDKLAI